MKWIRLLLPVILVVSILLSAGVVYADDEESGLDVDITVIGNDADVEVDLYGDDNTANVTFHSENPTVLINGQDINEPTVIVRSSGPSKGWIMKRIDQAVSSLYDWANETGQVLTMTMDGLAKVILTVEDQDSQLDVASNDASELRTRLETQAAQLDNHESRLSGLDAQVEALIAKDAILQAYVKDYANYLQAEYDRKLMVIIVVFSVMVVGLAVGLGVGFGLSIRRLNRNRL